MVLTGAMSARTLFRPRERRPILGPPWFIPRAVGAAAAPPPKVETETAAGVTADSPRHREALDLGGGPAVRAVGAPPRNRPGVAQEETEATGLAPATGHPATRAVRPERHVVAVMAAAVAVVSPAARAMMAERAAAMMPSLPRNVAAQEICQRVRPMPRAILEARRKVSPSPFPSCQRRRLTTSHGSRPSRIG